MLTLRYSSGVLYYFFNNSVQPIPLAARSNVWVRGHSLAGIAGSNIAGSIDVSLL